MRDLILVTDGGNGGARSTLAAVRALAAADYRTLVTVSSRMSLAAASRYRYATVVTPRAEDPAYAGIVEDAAKANRAACILPASDVALLALGEPVRGLVNKVDLARRARQIGIPMPESERIESDSELFARAKDFPYPIILKPEISGPPTIRIANERELEGIQLACPVVVQPYVEGDMEAVAGVIRDGALIAAVHQKNIRTWPMDCGTSCFAVTVREDLEREAMLTELLGDYNGIFQLQFLDGMLLDVNPRVYGSLPLAVASGVNLAALHVESILQRLESKDILRGRVGVSYRWLDGDLRHVGSLLLRGRFSAGLAAAIPRIRTVHSIWSLADPLPSLVRARMMLSKVW